MTQLQDEVLKLLEECKIDITKEELEEASFEQIKKAGQAINTKDLLEKIQKPASRFSTHCEKVTEALEKAIQELKIANQVYEFNNNSRSKQGEKGTLFQKMKNKIGDMKAVSDNKYNVLNALKDASRQMSQAQYDLTQARFLYSQLNKELKNLYNSVETVQKLVDSKTSWFGRNFKFWK